MFERTKQLDATIEELDAAAQHENDYAPQERRILVIFNQSIMM